MNISNKRDCKHCRAKESLVVSFDQEALEEKGECVICGKTYRRKLRTSEKGKVICRRKEYPISNVKLVAFDVKSQLVISEYNMSELENSLHHLAFLLKFLNDEEDMKAYSFITTRPIYCEDMNESVLGKDYNTLHAIWDSDTKLYPKNSSIVAFTSLFEEWEEDKEPTKNTQTSKKKVK